MPGHLPIIDMQQQDSREPPLAGFLGADILARSDLEIDLPRSRLVLWHVAGCSGDFVPWATAHADIPAQMDRYGLLIVPANLDGNRVHAVLDTGASWNVIGRSTATYLQVPTDPSARHVVATPTFSLDIDLKVAQLRELEFGPLRLMRPFVGILDTAMPSADMVIGWPMLRRRRVWLSYATGQVFVTRRPISPVPASAARTADPL